MIKPILNSEDTAYLGESTRLDASRSLLSDVDGPIVTLTIQSEGISSPISCLNEGYLDVVYTTTGAKDVTVTVNGSTQVFTGALNVIDPATLLLFSKDTDLVPFEPDCFKYLPEGWSKFTRLHKRAQETIIDSLDEKGIFKKDDSRYGAGDLFDASDVKSWAIALVLNYLYEGLSNQVDDIFSKKALKYFNAAEVKANRSAIRLKNEDATIIVPDVHLFSSSRLERL